MVDRVISFIYRRFPNRSYWDKENSYFFALILKKEFYGTIYFDKVNRCFCCKIGQKYYNYNGIYPCKEDDLVSWQTMYEDDFENWRDIIEEFCR